MESMTYYTECNLVPGQVFGYQSAGAATRRPRRSPPQDDLRGAVPCDGQSGPAEKSRALWSEQSVAERTAEKFEGGLQFHQRQEENWRDHRRNGPVRNIHGTHVAASYKNCNPGQNVWDTLPFMPNSCNIRSLPPFPYAMLDDSSASLSVRTTLHGGRGGEVEFGPKILSFHVKNDRWSRQCPIPPHWPGWPLKVDQSDGTS